jgi:hypothetical protein
MPQIKIDEQVQLTQDIPELGLHRGEEPELAEK